MVVWDFFRQQYLSEVQSSCVCFNPSEKYARQIESSPQWHKLEHIWNHHPAIYIPQLKAWKEGIHIDLLRWGRVFRFLCSLLGRFPHVEVVAFCSTKIIKSSQCLKPRFRLVCWERHVPTNTSPKLKPAWNLKAADAFIYLKPSKSLRFHGVSRHFQVTNRVLHIEL